MLFSIRLTPEQIHITSTALAEYADRVRHGRTLAADLQFVQAATLRRALDDILLQRRRVVDDLKNISYAEYLLTDHWKKVRDIAVERDGYRCKLCTKAEGLQVHHSTYEHRGEEEDYLEDLITLCGDCHAKFHGKEPA